MTENKVKMQPTPNPNSMKFVLSKAVVPSGMLTFENPAETASSPLASRLFGVEGVTGVFMMNDFVSVNKVPGGNWGEIAPKVMEILKAF